MLLTAKEGNNAHVPYVADGCLHWIKERSGGLGVGLLQQAHVLKIPYRLFILLPL